ncbi:MAG: Txe/YoeB family addiction module toxin [Anaerolineales bacterium]|jgi:toxin YoeB|nr:Txe/YoeB family addiction module toxin [Anaerolineales bacterium]
MRIVFTESAWSDYQWFQERDRQLLKRINQLIKETARTPFEGIGKPEALKADLSGYWSRRIDDEHRLVYTVTKTDIIIVACRYHYSK